MATAFPIVFVSILRTDDRLDDDQFRHRLQWELDSICKELGCVSISVPTLTDDPVEQQRSLASVRATAEYFNTIAATMDAQEEGKQ